MNSRFAPKNSSNRKYVCSGVPNPSGKVVQLVCQAVNDSEAVDQPIQRLEDYPAQQEVGRGPFPPVDHSKCDDCDRPGPKAYVKADAPPGGNGKKKNPYNTLAQAQADTTWKTLVVLYSTVPLTGGITMPPGTTIYGDDGNYPAKPLLTNPTSATNGGNCIVASGGSLCVQNLEFDNVWASAVEFSNAQNITVVECDVHGYNQGEVIVPLKGQDQEIKYIPAAGIHGQCQNSGTTIVCNVSIHDNHTGDGFLEVAYNTAIRQVSINRSDIRQLVNVFPNLPLTNTSIKGISVVVTSPNAVHNVAVVNTNIQDFAPDGVSTRGENFSKHAIFADSNNGGQTSLLVNNCTISNIFQDTPTVGTPWIYAGTHPVVGSTVATIAASKKSVMNLTVTNCDFTAPAANGGDVMVATLTCNCNGIVTSTFKANTITNVFLGFISFSKGIAKDTIAVTGNNAVCLGAFCVAVSEQDYICNVPGAMNTTYTITANNFQGGNVFGGMGIVPHWSANGIGFGVSKWASLNITAKGNCFDGSGGNLGFNAGIFGLDLFGYGTAANTLGNIKFIASANNIVNYTYCVFDALGSQGLRVQYLIKGNFWGAVPLTPMVNTVVLTPSTMDAASPADSLTQAITCPVPVGPGPVGSRDQYGYYGTPPTAVRQVSNQNRRLVRTGITIDVPTLLASLAPIIAKLQLIRF